MKTKMEFAAVALGLAIVLSTGIATAQVSTHLTAEGTMKPVDPEVRPTQAPLSPEEQQRLADEHREEMDGIMNKKPPVAPGPRRVKRQFVPETQIETPASFLTALPAPDGFYIGSNQTYSVSGKDGKVAEPSVANSGKNWFATQNSSAGYSSDAGVTWTKVPVPKNPPVNAPNFCCDQDVVHDHGRNVTIWSRLFLGANRANGVVRIEVRSADNLTDLCHYDIDGGPGVKHDYPHLGLGNDFLYLTANVLTKGKGWTGAKVWRFKLDQLASCQTVGYRWFNWKGSVGQVIWTPARGTTDTMYLVTIENSSQNRFFWWPESSKTLSSKLIDVPAVTFGQSTCIGGASGNNYIEKGATSAIGLTMRSSVGWDNGEQYVATYYGAMPSASRPQAYEAGMLVRTSDQTLLSTPDLWNPNMCMAYADVTSNSRGDLGMTIAAGGSLTGGSVVQGYVGISDSYSRGANRGKFTTIYRVASGDDNPSVYGDYLTARVQEPVDTAFIATSYAWLAGATNTHIVEFMRGRYAQAYKDRGQQ
jgi:hypothetical protein